MPEETKSYSQMRKEFYEKYVGNIVPAVQKYENLRKIKLVLAIIISSIFMVSGAFVLYSIFTTGGFTNRENSELLKAAIFLFSMSFVVWWWFKKSFENKVKKQIMPIVCGCFGDMQWSCDQYEGGEVFSASGAVPSFTSEQYDDIFWGTFKDVNIEIVEPKYTVGSGKHRRTVFDGVIVKLAMNKNFTSHTVIKPNSLIKMSPLKALRHTELEDVEFNKKFDVYTNDEIDARYLITPSFMERLKNIKTAFKASSVSCAFYGDLLIIALPTNKDIFSICSLIKKVDDSKQFFQMYEEIISIVKLIDYFKLDQKIGL